jgi:hypothetical protein
LAFNFCARTAETWAMAQISRPFQIGLVVVVLLAGVWLFALQGHSSSPSGASSTSSTPVVTSSVSPGSTHAHPASPAHSSASTASAQGQHAATPTAAHHGHETGVDGLLHAVRKAHEAAAVSQQNANEVERKSREASNEPASAQHSPAPATAPASGSRAAATPSSTGTSAAATSAHSSSTAGKSSSASTLAVPTGQREVEAELKQGKIAVLLFWNPAGSDDVVVHNELRLLLRLHTIASKAKTEEFRHAEKFFGLELAKKIVVHEALASQVASYGSITSSAQIYGTPTILVINPRGQMITLTGITDAYSIEQAIEEARAA